MRLTRLCDVLVLMASIALLCLPWPAVHGAGGAPPPGNELSARPSMNSEDPLGAKDPRQFFPWYLKMHDEVTERSQFETEEEYLKRQPPAFDSEKTIYFRVERHGEYSYDINTKTLTLTQKMLAALGETLSRSDLRYYIILASDEVARESYVAQNAYGAETTVEKTTAKFYELVFLNERSSPQFDLDTGKISVTLTLEPREAERLSKSYEFVLGVRLPGFSQSEFKATRLGPKFDFPYDYTHLTYEISAVLREVIIRDRNTLEVLRRVPVEGDGGTDGDERAAGAAAASPQGASSLEVISKVLPA